MQIIRKRLSETEGQNPGQRYNPDCDCIEYTPDGGITWVEDETSDPRTNPVYLLPPNTEPDIPCAAAAGMVAYIRASVDTAIDTATIVGLANGIFAIVVAFLPITILAAVIIAIAEYLIGLGAAALIAAFTEPVYEQLLCIFLDELDADGRITEEGFTDAQAVIASEIGDVVVDGVIAVLYSSTGAIGWSNAGAQLADGEADCAVCRDEHCLYIDFKITDGSEYGVTLGAGLGDGNWIPGSGWQSVASGGGQDVYLTWIFPNDLECYAVESTYTKTTGSGVNNASNLRSLHPLTNYATTQVAIESYNPVPVFSQTNAIIDPAYPLLSGFSHDVNTGDTAGSDPCWIEAFILRYRGEIPPGWTDNCPD